MLLMVSPETTSVAVEASIDGNAEGSIQFNVCLLAVLELLLDPHAASSTAAKVATVPSLTAELIFIIIPTPLSCV